MATMSSSTNVMDNISKNTRSKTEIQLGMMSFEDILKLQGGSYGSKIKQKYLMDFTKEYEEEIEKTKVNISMPIISSENMKTILGDTVSIPAESRNFVYTKEQHVVSLCKSIHSAFRTGLPKIFNKFLWYKPEVHRELFDGQHRFVCTQLLLIELAKYNLNHVTEDRISILGLTESQLANSKTEEEDIRMMSQYQWNLMPKIKFNNLEDTVAFGNVLNNTIPLHISKLYNDRWGSLTQALPAPLVNHVAACTISAHDGDEDDDEETNANDEEDDDMSQYKLEHNSLIYQAYYAVSDFIYETFCEHDEASKQSLLNIPMMYKFYDYCLNKVTFLSETRVDNRYLVVEDFINMNFVSVPCNHFVILQNQFCLIKPNEEKYRDFVHHAMTVSSKFISNYHKQPDYSNLFFKYMYSLAACKVFTTEKEYALHFKDMSNIKEHVFAAFHKMCKSACAVHNYLEKSSIGSLFKSFIMKNNDLLYWILTPWLATYGEEGTYTIKYINKPPQTYQILDTVIQMIIAFTVRGGASLCFTNKVQDMLIKDLVFQNLFAVERPGASKMLKLFAEKLNAILFSHDSMHLKDNVVQQWSTKDCKGNKNESMCKMALGLLVFYTGQHEMQLTSMNCIELEHIYAKKYVTSQPHRKLDDSNDVYSLGNLTLLSRAKNRKIGNKSFEEKMAEYKQSNIPMTLDLAKYQQFASKEIKERALELASKIEACTSSILMCTKQDLQKLEELTRDQRKRKLAPDGTVIKTGAKRGRKPKSAPTAAPVAPIVAVVV